MTRFALVALVLLAPVTWAQSITVEIDLTDQLVVDAATIGLRGDTPPLAWDRSLPMVDSDGDGIYTATVDFPQGTGSVRYKAVIDGAAEIQWEPGDNRFLLPGRMTVDRRAFGGAQPSLPERTVSTQQLAQDVTLLQQAMQSVHPGLTLHRTQGELGLVVNRLSSQVRSLAAEYGEAIPVSKAYLPITQALAGIRDGHTHLNPYNQSDYTTATLFGRADRVPFTFRLIEDRMVVTADATPDGVLPAGTEILTMDGTPIADIVARLTPLVRADGSNDAKRRHLLQVVGTPPAEDFDILYSLVYEPTGDLALTVRQPDGTETDLSVSRTTRDVRLAVLSERNADLRLTNDDELEVRIIDDGTGYVRVGTFASFNMNLDYDDWLADAFRQLAEVDRLVVDLRGNEGGLTDAATALFRYLITEPTEVSLWGSVMAYDVFPDALRPHVRSWDASYLDPSDRLTPLADGTFRLEEPRTVAVPPSEGAYLGPVSVLIDAAASSATFQLARVLQETGAAVLVGEETGGSLRGLNGSLSVFLTLPHTGIVVDVPLIGSRPAEPGPDHGVVPDVLAAPTVGDLIQGRDPVLDAALAAL